jgi:hypothetical protein
MTISSLDGQVFRNGGGRVAILLWLIPWRGVAGSLQTVMKISPKTGVDRSGCRCQALAKKLAPAAKLDEK